MLHVGLQMCSLQLRFVQDSWAGAALLVYCNVQGCTEQLLRVISGRSENRFNFEVLAVSISRLRQSHASTKPY